MDSYVRIDIIYAFMCSFVLNTQGNISYNGTSTKSIAGGILMEVPFEALRCFSQVDTSRSSGRLFIGRHHQKLWDTFLRQTPLEARGGLSQVGTTRSSGRPFLCRHHQRLWRHFWKVWDAFLCRHHQRLWESFLRQTPLEVQQVPSILTPYHNTLYQVLHL